MPLEHYTLQSFDQHFTNGFIGESDSDESKNILQRYQTWLL